MLKPFIDTTKPRFHRTGPLYLTGLIDFCIHVPEYLRECPFVEIGCFSGEASEVFAQIFTGPKYFVDIWDRTYFSLKEGEKGPEEIFDDRMARFEGSFTKVKLSSAEAAQGFVNSGKNFGTIYIDAAHDYKNVVSDINSWHPLLHLGVSVIGGHDYDATATHLEDHIEVVNAVNDTIGVPDLLFMDSSWMKIVTKGVEK
jgi:hypothetical protein